MNRRLFLTSFAATTATALGPALAYPAVDYAPETWPGLRDSGQTVILNWRASWSLTCQIKHDLIADLLEQNPAYGQLTFVDVDWDTFGPSQMAERLKVERRSTLIALQGPREIARLVNEPYAHSLRRFLDAALAG